MSNPEPNTSPVDLRANAARFLSGLPLADFRATAEGLVAARLAHQVALERRARINSAIDQADRDLATANATLVGVDMAKLEALDLLGEGVPGAFAKVREAEARKLLLERQIPALRGELATAVRSVDDHVNAIKEAQCAFRDQIGPSLRAQLQVLLEEQAELFRALGCWHAIQWDSPAHMDGVRPFGVGPGAPGTERHGLYWQIDSRSLGLNVPGRATHAEGESWFEAALELVLGTKKVVLSTKKEN